MAMQFSTTTARTGTLIAVLCFASACSRGQRSEHGGPTAKGSAPSQAGSRTFSAGSAAHDLATPLRVVPLAPQESEPIALIGGKDILCARRHEASFACVGDLGLRLRPPKEADWPLYPDGEKTKTPLGLVGRNLSQLDAHGYGRCIIEAGSPLCWRGPEKRRDIQAVDMGDSEVVEVRSYGVMSTAVRTQDGTYWQSPFHPCKDRPYSGPAARAPGGLGKVRKLLGGEDFECAITVARTVACWGQVNAPDDCTEEAVTIEGLTNTVDGAAGLSSACVLRSDNRILCFGDNRSYGLGVPPEELTKSYTPVEVAGVYPAVKIDGIDDDYVALGANGEVWAWGSGHLDQKEDGHAKRFDVPRPAIDVAVLDGMFCALLDDHSLHCDGDTVRRGLKAGTGRPKFESKELWVNAVPHKIVELVDDPFGGNERDEARKKQGLPPWAWN